MFLKILNSNRLHIRLNLCNFAIIIGRFYKNLLMNKIYTYILFLLPLLGLFSCSGTDSKKTTVSDSDTSVLDSLNDSAAVEEAVVDLSTTEAQLNMMKSSGSWDKYESGILPQMAEDVPNYSKEILENEGKRFIIVDKGKMKLFLYDSYGNIEKSYGIACAKNYGTKQKKGDSRTTEGIFDVKGVFDSTEWLFTNDAGYTSPVKGQYGPRFIRITTPYIGIHGTGSPGSIGRRCSHGCIRVTNDNIMELVDFVEEGMKVIISPGPRDMAVNKSEGTDMPSVATEPGVPRAVPGKDTVSLTNTSVKKTTQQENTSVENTDIENPGNSNSEEPINTESTSSNSQQGEATSVSSEAPME